MNLLKALCLFLFFTYFLLQNSPAIAQKIGKGLNFLCVNGTNYKYTVSPIYSDSSTVTKASAKGNIANIGIAFFQSKSSVLGFRLNYSNSVLDSLITNNLSSSKTKEVNNFWGISTFARFYKKINRRILLFVDADFCIGSNSQRALNEKVTALSAKTTFKNIPGNFGNSISVVAKPGMLILLNSAFGVEFAYGNWNFSYTNFQPEKGSGNENVQKNSSGFNFKTSSLNIGLHYFFRKKERHSDTTSPSIAVLELL